MGADESSCQGACWAGEGKLRGPAWGFPSQASREAPQDPPLCVFGDPPMTPGGRAVGCAPLGMHPVLQHVCWGAAAWSESALSVSEVQPELAGHGVYL